MFPRKIKNFNAFLGGVTFVGKVTEATLPNLKAKTSEFRGGGMHGAVDVMMGQEKMETSVTFAEWNPLIFQMWGTVNSLVLRPAAQGEGDFSADPHVFTMRGRFLGVEPDALKVADDANLKAMMNPVYFRAVNAGVETVEIDVENMIHRIGGIDQMAEMRAAMGA